jgi:hypothetical protein
MAACCALQTTPRYLYADNSFIVDGDNVVAVEVHQCSASNADARFDLRLLISEGSVPVDPTPSESPASTPVATAASDDGSDDSPPSPSSSPPSQVAAAEASAAASAIPSQQPEVNPGVHVPTATAGITGTTSRSSTRRPTAVTTGTRSAAAPSSPSSPPSPSSSLSVAPAVTDCVGCTCDNTRCCDLSLPEDAAMVASCVSTSPQAQPDSDVMSSETSVGTVLSVLQQPGVAAGIAAGVVVVALLAVVVVLRARRRRVTFATVLARESATKVATGRRSDSESSSPPKAFECRAYPSQAQRRGADDHRPTVPVRRVRLIVLAAPRPGVVLVPATQARSFLILFPASYSLCRWILRWITLL